MLVGTVVGIIVIAALYAIPGPYGIRVRRRTIFVIAALLFTFVVVVRSTQVGQRAYNWFLEEGLSREGRIAFYVGDWHLFLRSPLIGLGADGFIGPGHSLFLMAAYEYGLIYLIPLVIACLIPGYQLMRLIGTSHDSRERALLVGLLGSWAVVIVLGVPVPIFASLVVAMNFWVLAVLVGLWSQWRRVDPHAPLVAGVGDASKEPEQSTIRR